MVVKNISVCWLISVLALFGKKVAECRRQEGRDEDSMELFPGSVTLEYLEEYIPIKEHVIPFLGSFEDLGLEEVKEVEESPEEVEVGAYLHTALINFQDSEVSESRSNKMNFKLEPSYSYYAFVNNRQPLRSCSIDDQEFKAQVSRLARWGSEMDKFTPDLKEMIENNRNSKGVLLVDFFATWCGPCRRMNENLEVIKDHYQSDKLTVFTIDVDQDKRYTQEYQINALPSLLLFVRGSLHKKLVGLTDVKTLIQEIDSTLDTIS